MLASAAMKLQFPQLKGWDLAAVVVAAAGVALAAMSIVTALATDPGTSPSNSSTLGVIGAQLLVCCASLLILGKTSKQGTIWGNLSALAGTFIGMSGVLLAGALWAAA